MAADTGLNWVEMLSHDKFIPEPLAETECEVSHLFHFTTRPFRDAGQPGGEWFMELVTSMSVTSG